MLQDSQQFQYYMKKNTPDCSLFVCKRYKKEDEGCPAIVHHLKAPCSFEQTGSHNHDNVADITKRSKMFSKMRLPNCWLPNCQVTKLSSYQIVRLPNCQVTKLLVTKLWSYQIFSYQIVKLPNCQVTKLLVTKMLFTKLSSYQIISYQIVSYQNVSYQIISYQ